MTNEQIYHDALLAIATFFNGNPMKWPKSHDACSAMVEIADKALNAGETNVHEPLPCAALTRYQMVIGREAQAPYDLVPCEVEHPNGEWVKYEDVQQGASRDASGHHCLDCGADLSNHPTSASAHRCLPKYSDG